MEKFKLVLSESCISAQLSGGDHSSLDFRHQPVQPGDSSSAAPREPRTLHVLPIRTHLDEVKLLKRGDVYTGRGCRERSLKRTFLANRKKVAQCGRS